MHSRTEYETKQSTNNSDFAAFQHQGPEESCSEFRSNNSTILEHLKAAKGIDRNLIECLRNPR